MKRYGILAFFTAVTVAALLFFSVRLPVSVQTITVTAQTAAKTELCPARVTDQTHLQVFLRESLASTVTAGQAVVVTGAGFRESAYNGTISAVAEEATVQNGKTVLPAVVTLENGDDSLKKGLSATVRVTVRTHENAVVVESDRLRTDNGGTFVWVAKNGRVRRQPVTLGDTVDGGTIAENLPVGTRLILTPDTLRDGQRINEEAAS